MQTACKFEKASCKSTEMATVCESDRRVYSKYRSRSNHKALSASQHQKCMLMLLLQGIPLPTVRSWTSTIPLIDLSRDEESAAEDVRLACMKFGFFTSEPSSSSPPCQLRYVGTNRILDILCIRICTYPNIVSVNLPIRHSQCL
jgi:hypothetical protein